MSNAWLGKQWSYPQLHYNKCSTVKFQMPKCVSTFSLEGGALLSNTMGTLSVMESVVYERPQQEGNGLKRKAP